MCGVNGGRISGVRGTARRGATPGRSSRPRPWPGLKRRVRQFRSSRLRPYRSWGASAVSSAGSAADYDHLARLWEWPRDRRRGRLASGASAGPTPGSRPSAPRAPSVFVAAPTPASGKDPPTLVKAGGGPFACSTGREGPEAILCVQPTPRAGAAGDAAASVRHASVSGAGGARGRPAAGDPRRPRLREGPGAFQGPRAPSSPARLETPRRPEKSRLIHALLREASCAGFSPWRAGGLAPASGCFDDVAARPRSPPRGPARGPSPPWADGSSRTDPSGPPYCALFR